MKKLVFMFVTLVAMSFASCGGNTSNAVATDSVAVDSIDTVAVDTVDTVVTDSVIASE